MTKSILKNVLVLALTILVDLFWVIGSKTNVYNSSIVGGFFEFASLPMLGLGIGLPIFSIYLIVKNVGATKVWPILSLMVSIIAFFLIIG